MEGLAPWFSCLVGALFPFLDFPLLLSVEPLNLSVLSDARGVRIKHVLSTYYVLVAVLGPGYKEENR